MERRNLLAAALGLAPWALAQGQDFPSRPVRLVVGFPPGGGTDLVARPLSLNIDFWRCNTYVLADACDINQAERLDGSIVHVAEVGHA